MTPTRRKPTRRTNAKKSIDGVADALFVEGARPEAVAVEAHPAESVFAPEGAAAKRASGAAEPKASDPHEPAEPRAHAAYGETPHPGVVADHPLQEDQAPHDEVEGPAPFKVVSGRRPSKPAASENGEGKRRPSIVRLVLVAIVAVLIVVEGGFCLMRWAVDDALDMQGSWYVNGSASTIAITGESIVLAEDVAYEYSIDEGAKTISYSFGIMEGQGRYRFSLDRAQLAIIDGEYTFMDTLTSDIAWTFEALIAQIKGEPLAPGAGDNAMLLTRVEASSPDGAPLAGEGTASSDDAQSGEKDTQFAGDVSDVSMINGGGHPLLVSKA